MDGVLVIDKPAGPTSHDVVAIARRALRERRVGHTGTLDPLATGVLPLVVGRATRLASLLSSGEKEYVADVRLGAATATYDAADRLAAGGAPPPAPDLSLKDIEATLVGFRGSFEQMPPPFSAKKIAGVPAYELARKNQAPALTAVTVTVRLLEVLSFDAGLLRLKMTTSAGFYVRSLAHDIGVQLGCGAHLEALRRTRAGAFLSDCAVRLAELLDNGEAAAARVIPLEQLLPEIPAAHLTEHGAFKAAHGNSLTAADVRETPLGPDLAPSGETRGKARVVRLISPGGALLGIAQAGPDGLLRPSIVLV